LEHREAAPEDLVELRRVVLEQLALADLPRAQRKALEASEAVTRPVPEPEDILELLSGELYLPRVSGALRENILAAADGKVWIEGTTTPQPFVAARTVEHEALQGLAGDEVKYWKAALVLYPGALELRGADAPSARFE